MLTVSVGPRVSSTGLEASIMQSPAVQISKGEERLIQENDAQSTWLPVIAKALAYLCGDSLTFVLTGGRFVAVCVEQVAKPHHNRACLQIAAAVQEGLNRGARNL